MGSSEPDQHAIRRLLKLLAVKPRKPSPEALAELVTAYLMRVPFENVSKLYYKQLNGAAALPDPEVFVDGVERYGFGGTCYANNYHLNRLLAHLGYDAMLCGADMENPDVHVVNIVRLDGREYLVDAGYAAPFLKPMPRDLTEDFVVALGRDRYVLRPQDGNGCSRMDLYREGKLRHGYTVKPIAREIGYFSDVIADSYRETATFMNAVLLVRWYAGRSIAVHNLTVMEASGRNWRIYRMQGRDEMVQAVEMYFGIPTEITSAAIAGIGEFGNAWS